MLRCRNNARKFYQKVKRLTEGYKLEASSCKNEHGNFVTDPQGVLRLWRKHFSTLLQSDNYTKTAFRDFVPNPIDDDCVDIPLPSHEQSKSQLCVVKTVKRQVVMAFPLNCLRPKAMSWQGAFTSVSTKYG